MYNNLPTIIVTLAPTNFISTMVTSTDLMEHYNTDNKKNQFRNYENPNKYQIQIVSCCLFCRLVLYKVLANHDMHFIVRFPVPEHLVV